MTDVASSEPAPAHTTPSGAALPATSATSDVAGRVQDDVLRLRFDGDPVLRQISAPVVAFDTELRDLVAAMSRLMVEANGIGLAAVQVGVLSRLFVYLDLDAHALAVAINPRLDRATVVGPDEQAQLLAEHAHTCPPEHCEGHDGILVEAEGCLSIPGRFDLLPRPGTATITAQDVHGEPYTRTASGLLVRCWAHESDHLDGILFPDHLARHSTRPR